MSRLQFRVWMSNDKNPDGKMYYPGDSIEIGVGNHKNPHALLMSAHGDLYTANENMLSECKEGVCRARWANNNIVTMLSTGLSDKNGKMIFEGDLIKCPVTGNKEIHGDYCINEVIINNGLVMASFFSSKDKTFPRGWSVGSLLDCHYEYSMKLMDSDTYHPETEIEIIGTIHTHKHLLGEKT